MTVRELITALEKMPKRATVYMVTDRSLSNQDDETGRYRQVYGVDCLEREDVYSETMWDNETETNVMILTEEPDVL